MAFEIQELKFTHMWKVVEHVEEDERTAGQLKVFVATSIKICLNNANHSSYIFELLNQ